LGDNAVSVQPYGDGGETQDRLATKHDCVLPSHVVPPRGRLQVNGAVHLDRERAEVGIEIAGDDRRDLSALTAG
jgi:hypothetical protein